MIKTIEVTGKEPIIMISMSRWDGDYSSAAISLAKEFSKTNHVYYFDHPFTLKELVSQFRSPRIKNRLKSLLFGTNACRSVKGYPEKFHHVVPRVVLSINWMPKGFFHYFLLGFNERIFFSGLRKVLKEEKIDRFIFFNSYNPFYGRTLPKDLLKKAYFVYQSRDDISQSEYVSKHGVNLEREAILNANLSLATGKSLVKKLSRFGPKVSQLPNAADIEIFKSNISWERPAELKGITKKIIGYTGNICHRVDYDLLYTVAKEHKDKVLVMVGPRNDLDKHTYDFEGLGNVIFTGAKNIRDLPAYLQYFDCTIIPFKMNELTKGIYPLKVNEYLAMGKPLVSTPFSPDIKEFGEVIYLAEHTDDFVKKIDQAIHEDNDELKTARIELAKTSSWTNRVALFWKLLKNANEKQDN